VEKRKEFGKNGKGTDNCNMKKVTRFCCWCGKVEHTKTCQSKSLRRVTKEISDKIMNGKNGGGTDKRNRVPFLAVPCF